MEPVLDGVGEEVVIVLEALVIGGLPLKSTRFPATE